MNTQETQKARNNSRACKQQPQLTWIHAKNSSYPSPPTFHLLLFFHSGCVCHLANFLRVSLLDPTPFTPGHCKNIPITWFSQRLPCPHCCQLQSRVSLLSLLDLYVVIMKFSHFPSVTSWSPLLSLNSVHFATVGSWAPPSWNSTLPGPFIHTYNFCV